MRFVKDGDNYKALLRTDEGLPSAADYGEIGEGTTLLFVDTGEEYIFYNGMWEMDLRKALPQELIYNGA
jgi:hypothetical protein